ncbi:MAG: oxidoreductase [Actinomyces sp.]|nr:MAG: oxidoreductase [Actinomyces sp.]
MPGPSECPTGDQSGPDGRRAADLVGRPLELPCGTVLPNRTVKAAMSDSLGDGAGNPTDDQLALYRRWAEGAVAVAIVGEVQIDPRHPERPGNLVLESPVDAERLRRLAEVGRADGTGVWLQLGHAGALADPRLSRPVGPSALEVEGLRCRALSSREIAALPATYARAARLARELGFGGVEIHAAHGFLLSQFLSPLFNHRHDAYGGPIENRCRLLLEVVEAVRDAVGPDTAVGVKINATDQLRGGLDEEEGLAVVACLDSSGVDLIDISGGTYFPGAPSSSERVTAGPYFVDFARRAREVTSRPLMVTGGIKTRAQAVDALASGAVDVVGVARGLALDPGLVARWLEPAGGDPTFPRFDAPPPGAVTAWYTLRLAAVARDREDAFVLSAREALEQYEKRDAERVPLWRARFAV